MTAPVPAPRRDHANNGVVVRVLVVEDARVHQVLIRHIIAEDPGLELVGLVDRGDAASAAAQELRPDVILMDLNLPGMSGLDAISEIMQRAPCPVVVYSAILDSSSGELALDATRRGAVHIERKLATSDAAARARHGARLCHTLKLMSKVRVVQRPKRAPVPPTSMPRRARPSLVLIGASTGGPPLLHQILHALPPPLPMPVLIAQHIAPGFEATLCRWLRSSGHAVQLATRGGTPTPGVVYVSPASAHLILNERRRMALVPLGAAKLAPSVDKTFRSAARPGSADIMAMLLTGMGRDGAEGLLALRQRGAETIAQSAETCAVNGMPGSAVALDAAQHVLSPEEIIALLRARCFVGAGT